MLRRNGKQVCITVAPHVDLYIDLAAYPEPGASAGKAGNRCPSRALLPAQRRQLRVRRLRRHIDAREVVQQLDLVRQAGVTPGRLDRR